MRTTRSFTESVADPDDFCPDLDLTYRARSGPLITKNEFIKYHPFNNPENEEQDFAPDNIIWKWI